MSSIVEGWSKPEVPQTEGADVAWEGWKAKARGMVVMLGGMLSMPQDAVLMLANTWYCPVLELGRLWQKEVDLLELGTKGRDVQAEAARASTTHPRARLTLPLA